MNIQKFGTIANTKKKSKTIFWVLFLCLAFSGVFTFDAPACTIAVVSGSVTPDGRPLLWKNRDKGSWIKNEAKFYTYHPYTTDGYIGIVDSDSYEDTKMWSGINDDGFSICNSLVSGFSSFNNGIFLKEALRTCSTVDEFETFLAGWTYGGLSGNFGVIDNYGGAAMFEINTLAPPPFYIRSDAAAEPHGYIVMANYNTYGGDYAGYLRKIRAEALLETAYASNNLSHRYIIRYVTKDMESVPGNPGPTDQYDTLNNISRWVTRSATVVHGTIYPESPHYSTLWTILGEPAFASAVPLFSYAHSVPFEMSAPVNQMAPMNQIVEDRELRCYDDNQTDNTIMPWSLFFPLFGDPPGIQVYALEIEDYALKRTSEIIAWWKSIKRFKIPEDFQEFADYTSENIYKCYVNEEFVKWKPLH